MSSLQSGSVSSVVSNLYFPIVSAFACSQNPNNFKGSGMQIGVEKRDALGVGHEVHVQRLGASGSGLDWNSNSVRKS